MKTIKSVIKSAADTVVYAIFSCMPKGILVHYGQYIWDKNNNSLFVSYIRNYFSRYYENAEPNEQKRIGLLFWRSRAAARYFKNRVFSDSVVGRFYDVISKYDGYAVCEIGTGNGELINGLSRRLANNRFIGVDLSNEQIRANKSRYLENTKLEFSCSDILEYLKNNALKEMVYISYVSLTTFTPDAVNELFTMIAKSAAPAVLALYEPADPIIANGDQSALRGGLAYSHNYITLAKKHGFDILVQQQFGSFMWLVCKAY
jgi:hypothetical protein